MRDIRYQQPLPRWATLLGAVFVALLLVALITVPILINYLTERHRNEVRNYIETGQGLTGEIQVALSHSLSGIQGFQATGRRAFAELYKDQSIRIEQLLARLKPISEHLGPEVVERTNELHSVIERWQQAVNENGLLIEVLPAEEFRQRMFSQDHLLETAHQVAVDYNLDLYRIREVHRESTDALAHLNIILTVLLTLLSLGAIVVVWRITKRLRGNAQDLATRVREEEVLRDKAERAVRSRDEMLRVVSHDLRNPLGNIALAGSMLENKDLAEEKKEHLLKMIHRLTERMNRIIQDLVDIARAESGQPIPLDLQDVSARTLVDEACALNRMNAEQKRIRFDCEGRIDDIVIRADRHRILQVLSNLIDNALKFSPEFGSVSVKVERTTSGAQFSITDVGPGIPESQMEQIFVPFWRDTRRPEAGIGLGLAIVKRIVELHGGGVGVRNEAVAGTTFYFWLPAAPKPQRLSA